MPINKRLSSFFMVLFLSMAFGLPSFSMADDSFSHEVEKSYQKEDKKHRHDKDRDDESDNISMNLPSNWPWRGITIVGTDYDPVRLKDDINFAPMNAVQLRLLPRRLAKRQGISADQAWEQTMQWVEAMLDQCQQLSVTAILSLEGFPMDPSTPYTQVSSEFWNNPDDLQEVVDATREMARRFAHRGAELGAYQVMSEPVFYVAPLGSGYIPDWSALLDRIVAAVRQEDYVRWVIAAESPWGLPTAYGGPYTPHLVQDDRMIYSAHMYMPKSYTHQGVLGAAENIRYPGVIDGQFWNKNTLRSKLNRLIDFQKAHNVPVMIGEFSVVRWAPGGEKYLKDLASIFKKHDWGYAYWVRNAWHGWNPDYNHEYPTPITDPVTGRVIRSHEYVANTYQKVGYNSKRWKTIRKIVAPSF